MGNHGAPAEYRAASSHTERWRARGEVDLSHKHLFDDKMERHQTVEEAATKTKIWMAKDQMDTDTSQTD